MNQQKSKPHNNLHLECNRRIEQLCMKAADADSFQYDVKTEDELQLLAKLLQQTGIRVSGSITLIMG